MMTKTEVQELLVLTKNAYYYLSELMKMLMIHDFILVGSDEVARFLLVRDSIRNFEQLARFIQEEMIENENIEKGTSNQEVPW